MIGKWNKSVILSYIGLSISILGIILVCNGIDKKYAFVCLMASGVCDMFDGTVARMCKRSEDEKLFGIELDSLVDVFSFLAFPTFIAISLGLANYYCYPVYVLYLVFGVARLAHFNITTEDTNKPRKYYEGLPVTTVSIVFPLIYLFCNKLENQMFNTIYLYSMLVVAFMFILKIKIPKPKLTISFLLLVGAILMSILYMVLL